MSDDLSNRGPRDRARVNVSATREFRYRTNDQGVSEQSLKEAMKARSGSVEAVKVRSSEKLPWKGPKI